MERMDEGRITKEVMRRGVIVGVRSKLAWMDGVRRALRGRGVSKKQRKQNELVEGGS